MRALSTVGKIIPWAAIGPAVYVSVEATPLPWTPFAIGSVIFAAVFVTLAQARRSFWFGVLGAVFILINLATALGNVATISEEYREGRSSVIERKQQIDGKRAALNIARKAQADVAGEVPAETIESQVQALIASDAPRWTASGHCDPDKITQLATRTLCDQIGKAQARKAAALKRDEIDAKLAEVDKETVFGAPSSADPYAESLARLLTVFGFQVSDEDKALLSSTKDWGKAIGLELMAAFGPMALTLLFETPLGSDPAPVPVSAPSNEGYADVEHKPAPVSSIALPAVVPHLPVEAAPLAPVRVEAAADEPSEPAPLPPSPRKRTVTKRKPEKREARPYNVIPFRKDVHEVHALLSSGKTQREVAALLGIGERTVRRIVAASKTGQMAAS
jgi:hypothetical protein